jgi:hypothetical protein
VASSSLPGDIEATSPRYAAKGRSHRNISAAAALVVVVVILVETALRKSPSPFTSASGMKGGAMDDHNAHREDERKSDEVAEAGASREPASVEEERELEREELESFRRRRRWAEQVLDGEDQPTDAPDEPQEE